MFPAESRFWKQRRIFRIEKPPRAGRDMDSDWMIRD